MESLFFTKVWNHPGSLGWTNCSYTNCWEEQLLETSTVVWASYCSPLSLLWPSHGSLYLLKPGAASWALFMVYDDDLCRYEVVYKFFMACSEWFSWHVIGLGSSLYMAFLLILFCGSPVFVSFGGSSIPGPMLACYWT